MIFQALELFSKRLKFFLVLSRLLLEVANLHVAKGSKTAIGASSFNILLLKNNAQATDSPCQGSSVNYHHFENYGTTQAFFPPC